MQCSLVLCRSGRISEVQSCKGLLPGDEVFFFSSPPLSLSSIRSRLALVLHPCPLKLSRVLYVCCQLVLFDQHKCAGLPLCSVPSSLVPEVGSGYFKQSVFMSVDTETNTAVIWMNRGAVFCLALR